MKLPRNGLWSSWAVLRAGCRVPDLSLEPCNLHGARQFRSDSPSVDPRDGMTALNESATYDGMTARNESGYYYQ